MSTATRKLLSNSQRAWAPSPDLSIKEEDESENIDDANTQITCRNLLHQHLFTDNELNDEDQFSVDDSDRAADEENDDTDDDLDEQDVNAIDSDYSSSPSILDENINFDLVYTLHSFQATVDGQATVKKGDALTLLDDSNSYWWLVRVLKSSEVGYIPAENIETPFERLARLNKYRNAEIPSLEQFTDHISQSSDVKMLTKNKKVMLSTSVSVQLQILIMKDNGDEIEEEAYEEWNEEMLNESDLEESELADNEKHENTVTATTTLIEEDIDEALIITKRGTAKDQAEGTEMIKISGREQCTAQQQKSKVIRIYAGNIDIIGAAYHSIRVYERTNVNELLADALNKFHISQLETKQQAFALHSTQSHPVKNSGVEYYITVKIRNGDEMILDPQDKPFAIHDSLTDHLTTPMPPLGQATERFAASSSKLGRKKNVPAPASTVSSVPAVQFFMHKRIRQVDLRSGRVYVKVSLSTTTANPAADKRSSINSTLRRITKKHTTFETKKDGKQVERIDKMIAIPANYTIDQLLSIALAKFHLSSTTNQQPDYHLLLSVRNEERLLDPKEVVNNVLKPHREGHFVLQNKFISSDGSLPIKSSTTAVKLNESNTTKHISSMNNNSKVFPEASQRVNIYTVQTQLDSHIEQILKRVDSKLTDYRPMSSLLFSQKKNVMSTKKNPNFEAPLSVSRTERGIDIHLPHGFIRSTALEDKEQTIVRNSLMKYPDIMVYQETINISRSDCDKTSFDRDTKYSRSMSLSEELTALTKYGWQYLNAYKAADMSNGVLNHLSITNEGKSLSSLDDLEKELHRIVNAHQIN